MELVEIRDLDGPNLFLRQAAIKIEIAVGEKDPAIAEAFTLAFTRDGQIHPELAANLTRVNTTRLVVVLTEAINAAHDRAGVVRPPVLSRSMEAPGHIVVAFGWTSRRLGRLIAAVAWQFVSGALDGLEERIDEIVECGAVSPIEADRPDMLADADRRIPIIAITGTNGKTTTTRLAASILMHSGKRVGWTSSSGVVIQGLHVLPGDYTGPAGAARVFEEPGLDVAILETARGGILLRGLGYESNDISVVTNISADHLGLQGVLTVDELARVKTIVPAVTKPGGFAVLNADDPLVLGMRDAITARTCLISREASNPEIIRQRQERGWALWVANGLVHWAHDGAEEVLTNLNDVPVTFGGRAEHMVENALCAAAACLAIGVDLDDVRTGLAAFRNEADRNRGRLNVYDVNGVTVIVDFAHNIAGLSHLLRLGRRMVEGSGRLAAIVGTAGDRPDDVFHDIGYLAATNADHVIVKDTRKYLRGRQAGETIALLLQGAQRADCDEIETAPDEMSAYERGLAWASPGDVVAIMCIEDADALLERLEATGSAIS